VLCGALRNHKSGRAGILGGATMKKPTYKQLEQRLIEALAQHAHVYHFASNSIHKTENLMGSGVLLQLTFLGGKEVFPPVVIRDGLSRETIEAIKADLKKSYNLAVMFFPK
jgi:hypothetical protein